MLLKKGLRRDLCSQPVLRLRLKIGFLDFHIRDFQQTSDKVSTDGAGQHRPGKGRGVSDQPAACTLHCVKLEMFHAFTSIATSREPVSAKALDREDLYSLMSAPCLRGYLAQWILG